MAVNIHIKIDGIEGMSEVTGFEKQIQVESWSWGMSMPTNFGSSTGGSAGKVNLNDMTFMHMMDKASPKLMEACCTGKHIKDAVMTFCKAGGDAVVPFLKITMNDLLISSVQVGGAANDTPIETVCIAFREYKVEYQEQDNKGAKKGGPVIAGFDVQKNKKA
ncbi:MULTISPECIES: type VI secretion system tube protein Hcp [Inhella]|uniref:Type VI secretion system tube protein Hcp n=1 Tax=Inhella proteolytica TaxID=2795029 RepID=A0A931J4P8_9BURK|nr:type VI secretion system tube protein Hcp [Inhella proteolytica]MBH9577738.1 type VI secretion system tube protein Hcp [Inhella proteolytica]